MSKGLAPSKSTVYLSNIPFSLTNNDLHQVFGEYGKLVKVTIMKDKISRKSKGVAFLLYLERDHAAACVAAVDGVQMFGRTLKAKLANDNGRAAEYIRRKEYPDKAKCYECGEEGHLSYNCPKNALGQREPPPKKQKIRKKHNHVEDAYDTDEELSDEESLSAAIAHEHEIFSASQNSKELSPQYSLGPSTPKRKVAKKGYFSDEECSD